MIPAFNCRPVLCNISRPFVALLVAIANQMLLTNHEIFTKAQSLDIVILIDPGQLMPVNGVLFSPSWMDKSLWRNWGAIGININTYIICGHSRKVGCCVKITCDKTIYGLFFHRFFLISLTYIPQAFESSVFQGNWNQQIISWNLAVFSQGVESAKLKQQKGVYYIIIGHITITSNELVDSFTAKKVLRLRNRGGTKYIEKAIGEWNIGIFISQDSS